MEPVRVTPRRMMPSPRPLRTLFAAALLAFVAASPASAAGWRYHEAQLEQPVRPDHYRVSPDGSLWSFSADGVRRSEAGSTTLLHRSARGTDLRNDYALDGVLLDDGGALLDVGGIDQNGGYCAVQRIDAQHRATWRVTIPLQYETCRGLSANGAGQAWLAAGEKLYPLSPTGSLRAPVVPVGALSYARRPVAVAADGSAIAATRLRGANGTRLSRFDPDGGERWSWVREDQRQLDLVTLAGDGIVAVVAEQSQGFDREVSRWDGDGVLRWSRPLPGGDVSALGVIAAAQGDVYLVIGPTQVDARRVQRIAADGNLRWQRELQCDSNEPGERRFALTADDGLALVCATAGGAQLVRLTSDGSVTALTLPLQLPRQVVLQPDGQLLVLGQRDSGPDSIARSLLVDGDDVTAAPLDGYRQPAPGELAGQQILPDGTVYLAAAAIAADRDDPRFTLSRIAADGRRVWTRELRGVPNAMRESFAAGAGRVCIVVATGNAPSLPDRLICLDDADGSELWSHHIGGDFAPTRLFVAGNGRVLYVRTTNSRHEVLRYSRSGAIEAMSAGAGGATRAVVDAAGRVSITTPAALIQYAIDGSTGYRVDSANAPLRLQDSGSLQGDAAAADGSLWLAGRRSGGSEAQRSVWAVDRDGRTRWVRDLGEFRHGELVRGDDAIYALQWTPVQVSTDPAGAISRVSKLRASDGALVWTYESANPASTTLSPAGGRIALSTDGRALLLVHSWTDRLRLQRIATGSGRREQEIWIACTKTCAQPAALALDAQGRARLMFDALDADRGQSAAVVAVDHAGIAAPAIRLDQPGIAGAWWSPYANGEGIAFDWLPASRTVFAAWFTYSTAGGNEDSELRWYTLQVNGVADGTSALELPILQTVGGNFAAAPTLAPRRVGTATLQFSDCNNASLDYVFDVPHNDGRRGTITLSRLSPATQACVLADGSTIPGSGAQPPANGFDAKLSGSWFDETTAGQGLQLTVQPDGVFFAPWFTFDPADAGNDAGRQHWFTLQGNLADARNGTAELVLVQTIGGVFDRVPTYNANAVGSATLRVQGCDRAELDYRFADESVAGAFRARSGTLRLTRAGGCAP